MKKSLKHLIAALILSALVAGGFVCILAGITGTIPAILIMTMGLSVFLCVGQWCSYLTSR